MRARGYRQKTIWVPDLRNPEVLAEYKRQAKLIAASDAAGDELEADGWYEAVDWPRNGAEPSSKS
jgi:predicted deacetylase